MQSLKNPARLVPLAFLAVILMGTAALMLPFARTAGESAPFLTALFVATSATGVTGLSPVDTATYWTGFGQGIIYVLFHIGGFGIMSAATLLGMVVSRRMGLSRQLIVQAEARGIAPGDVRSVLKMVLAIALVVEGIAVLLLTQRMMAAGEAFGDALWHAAFHAGAAFTNAGFSNYSAGFTGFQSDAIAQFALIMAIIIGGLGLPVLHDLRRRRLSLHSRLTLVGSAALTVLGALGFLFFEGGNAGTIAAMGPGDQILNALFHSANTRSCGLNTVDNGAFTEETMMMTYALMLTGAGSAGTGGGVKVTTVMILILAIWSELRGERDTHAFGRRISPSILREALAVVGLSVAVLMLATVVLSAVTTDIPLNKLIYEAISAFGNVGLSMGITADLPPAAQSVLILLMYLGRVGIVTVATGLALHPHRAEYRYPEERPIVG